MSLELFLGKDHVDYKNYIEHHNIVIDAIDELTYLSNTLDYNRLVVFFKEVVETFEYFKNIDEKDDNSEGFSNMNNKENLFLSIIDCDEYNNLIQFMVSYKETIIRKSEKLKKKIEDLLEFKIFVEPPDTNNTEDTQPNKYIERVYYDNVKLILSKMDDISEKLQNNIYEQLPYIDERKVKFDIKLITKNDIICILSSYRFLKMFVYKHMHVIDREYYTATKEDVLEFRKELYDIYTMLREHFNREKNLYVEDILAKFKQALEVVVKLEISKDVKDGGGSEAIVMKNTDKDVVVVKNTYEEDTDNNDRMDKQLRKQGAEEQDNKEGEEDTDRVKIIEPIKTPEATPEAPPSRGTTPEAPPSTPATPEATPEAPPSRGTTPATPEAPTTQAVFGLEEGIFSTKPLTDTTGLAEAKLKAVADTGNALKGKADATLTQLADTRNALQGNVEAKLTDTRNALQGKTSQLISSFIPQGNVGALGALGALGASTAQTASPSRGDTRER